MTERPQNLRTSDRAERTHNSRRYRAEPRTEAVETASHSYRGSHRAEHLHRADESSSSAYDHNSRMGRHHAYQSEARANRW